MGVKQKRWIVICTEVAFLGNESLGGRGTDNLWKIIKKRTAISSTMSMAPTIFVWLSESCCMWRRIFSCSLSQYRYPGWIFLNSWSNVPWLDITQLRDSVLYFAYKEGKDYKCLRFLVNRKIINCMCPPTIYEESATEFSVDFLELCIFWNWECSKIRL